MAEQEMLPVEQVDREWLWANETEHDRHHRLFNRGEPMVTREAAFRAIAAHRLAATKAADEKVEKRDALIAEMALKAKIAAEATGDQWWIRFSEELAIARAALAESRSRHG